MDRAIILSNNTKFRFKEMLYFLLGDEYAIATHDGGLNYILTRKKRATINDPINCLDFTWLELCTTILPEKLGMEFLIIPVNDSEFNLAEYLLEYYDSRKEKFIDEIVDNPYALDGEWLGV